MVLMLCNDPDIITRLDAYLRGILSVSSGLPLNYPIAPACQLGIRSSRVSRAHGPNFQVKVLNPGPDQNENSQDFKT